MTPLKIPRVPSNPRGASGRRSRAARRCSGCSGGWWRASGRLLSARWTRLAHVQGAAGRKAQRSEPNAFIRIDRQVVVKLVMPQVEWGRAFPRPCLILEEELAAASSMSCWKMRPTQRQVCMPTPVFWTLRSTAIRNSVSAFGTRLRKRRQRALHVGCRPAAKVCEYGRCRCQDGARRSIHAAVAQENFPTVRLVDQAPA